MIERRVTIRNEVGLHARPAAQFVETARQFCSDIKVTCNEKSANAKSMLKVLALGAKKGMEITLVVSGTDEEEALDALCALIEEGLGES